MKIRSFCLALALALPAAATHSTSAQSWTQTGAPITNWQAVAVSADGSKLIAVSGGISARGLIYTSTNSGTNWTPTTAPATNWTCVACSADGNGLAAGINLGGSLTGGVYESPDFGENWSSNNVGRCYGIASSADGSKLAAVNSSTRIFLSTNSGTSWFTNISAVNILEQVVSSADGSRLVIANADGIIIASTNGGSNWTETSSLSHEVTSLAASVDGLKLVAVAQASPGPKVYISTDGGNNWESNTVPARSDWFTCASSADGSKLAALGQKGVIYTSADFGATWTSNNVPALQWQSAAFSADGSQLLAASLNGGIWILQTTSSPQLNVASAGGNLAFSWLVPAMNFVLQQNSDLTTTDWTPLTNVPVLNLTNLQYQLTLSPPGGNTFYRLAAP